MDGEVAAWAVGCVFMAAIAGFLAGLLLASFFPPVGTAELQVHRDEAGRIVSLQG